MLSLRMALTAYHGDLAFMVQSSYKAFRKRAYLELLYMIVALNVQLLKTAVNI